MSIETMLEEAEQLQKEMQDMMFRIQRTQRGRRLSYEDLRTIFFLMKLGELKEEIKQLREAPQRKRDIHYSLGPG